MKAQLLKNKPLFWLGLGHFLLFMALLCYSPFNKIEVLGINSMLKPMKFALSIWIYSWTMALILNHFTDLRKVKTYSWVAVICMVFEQIAITFQAFRGELSHFNTTNTFGIVLFSLMGIFILTVTLWTAYMTYIFLKQKKHTLAAPIVLSIKIGLIYFIVFSLFGGYISSLQGHTVGAADGGEGLWFLNWSTLFGDLRVAHFFGIHSLQVIPLFGVWTSKKLTLSSANLAVKGFSIFYLSLIFFSLVQGFLGLAFLK